MWGGLGRWAREAGDRVGEVSEERRGAEREVGRMRGSESWRWAGGGVMEHTEEDGVVER